LILEEFCVFASFSETNIQKLIAINVMRHACKSMTASNNPSTVVKALNLTGYLLSQDCDGRASKHLEVLKGLVQLVPFLDSPNQNFRIESLYALEMLSKNMNINEFREVCSRYSCLNKVSKLL